MPLAIDACMAQHQGDRKEQQDRLAILAHPSRKACVFAVVADGMGGHEGGAQAAELVLTTARDCFNDYVPGAPSVGMSLLINSMRSAHKAIHASRFQSEKDPHSTAVMLLLQPGNLCWAHCGDSRFYRFRGADLLERTVDHSYVEYLLANGKITPRQAIDHPQQNLLLTSLGGEEEPVVASGETSETQAGDTFVLCSDGLWAYFKEDELGRIVAGNSARTACEMLIAGARERAQGMGDNVSVVVIKLVEKHSS